MGNAVVKQVAPASYFLMDRILDANCSWLTQYQKKGVHENNVVLGVFNSKTEDSLSHQGIRFGNSPIYQLKEFQIENNRHIYTFEKNVTLEVWHSPQYKCYYYTLVTPDFSHTGQLSPTIIGHFKKIDMFSKEFDTLGDLFKITEQLH
jgi:hypothetical protein